MATGIDSNLTPQNRLISRTNDNLQPSSSAMFTMIEIERDKSIDTSQIRYEGGNYTQLSQQNLNKER